MTVAEPRDKATAPFSCLIVEDDLAFAAMSAKVVRGEGGQPELAHTLSAAKVLATTKQFDLVLLDNHLPDGKGYQLFELLSRRNPESPIVMITGVPDLGEAISLTRNGLFEYLTKPVEVDALTQCLQRAKSRINAQGGSVTSAEMFATSPAMTTVLQQLRQAARHASSTVLLTGETGTGKDLAARMLHELTYPGASAPFLAVNSAAMPGEMFESELFGAERGAYTGAEKKRAGLVSAAAGGTLFLDEIAEVPLALQAKLLRLLEAREYRPLGSVETQTFAGRFVAATNKSLSEEVKVGRFREDLLYRLDVFAIELPPLRARPSDIDGLAELLLTQLATKYTRSKPQLTPEDLAALRAHSFPGNVRELRNVLERSLLKTGEADRWLALDRNWLQRATATAPPPSTSSMATANTSSDTPLERNLSPIEAQEYRLIRDTLGETNGGIRRAAGKLGMSPQALLRRLDKWPELRARP
jgi:DNA-binding NtrC family response regulator